ncbi:MAG: HD domain-containing phosphohydrolase [Pseudomonadota bacterium]
MNHTRKTKTQLIRELEDLHRKMAELEKSETERRQAEDKLRDESHRFTVLSENAPFGMIMIDAEGKFTYTNPKFKEIFGYDLSDVPDGKTWFRKAYPDPDYRHTVISAWIADLGKAEPGEKRPRVFTVTCKDGTKKMANLISVQLETGQQIVSCEDITERQRVEEALRLSEEKLSKSFRASPDWMTISTLEDGRYIDVNDAFVTLSGFSREEALGKTAIELGIWVDPQDRDRGVEIIKKEGFLKNFESRARLKSGEIRTVLWSLETFDFENQKFVIAINRDITELREAQEKLEQTLGNLRRALGGTIEALATTSETRDPYTAGHQRRVADLARTIAQEMGLPEDQVNGLRMAGAIHDLGKISVPAEILIKPTKLSDLEFGLIKIHPQIGYDVLKDIEFPWPIARMVLEHHERMNGSGYPNSLTGDQLLLETKILIVADVVEAIASYRPYRPALGIEVALEEIEKNKGMLYAPAVVEACLRLFGEKGYHLN